LTVGKLSTHGLHWRVNHGFLRLQVVNLSIMGLKLGKIIFGKCDKANPEKDHICIIKN